VDVRNYIDIHSYLYLRACGPRDKKVARDTLALPAEGFALCTPIYERMSVQDGLKVAVLGPTIIMHTVQNGGYC